MGMAWLLAEISPEGFAVGVASVIVAVLGAAGTLYALVSKTRRENREAVTVSDLKIKEAVTTNDLKVKEAAEKITKEQRADVLKEWADFAARLEKKLVDQEKEVNDLKAEAIRQRDRVHEIRDKANADVLRLTVQVGQCERDRAEQAGEIRFLQAAVQRLQAATGTEALGTTLPVLVVADMNGVILEVSPASASILEWLSTELVGQNVEVLVPEDLRPRHREGLRKVLETGTPPWTERPINTEALTKSGGRVKVAIHLKAWQDPDNGEWRFSGEIRERSQEPDRSA
jgi:PAS domain S-box-containing protein